MQHRVPDTCYMKITNEHTHYRVALQRYNENEFNGNRLARVMPTMHIMTYSSQAGERHNEPNRVTARMRM